MLSIIGLITILIVVVLLISGRVSPFVGLLLVPIAGAFAAGFNFGQIGGFFTDGAQSVFSVVVMFIFAIIFFGIMQDVGVFDPLINKMIALTRGNVVAVAVGTVVIAAIAQLDGSGASTFLITIPALLPLYKRLKMNPYLLLMLVGTSASIVNMVPWGGPLGRVAAVLEMDVTELWRPLIQIQFIGLILLIGLAVILGYREKRLIAKKGEESLDIADVVSEVDGEEIEVEVATGYPKLYWVNLMLTIGVIGILVWGIVPAGFAFMIGVSLALLINYPNIQDQMGRIQAHAPGAILMATIILAAGSFLGILNGTDMLNSIAADLVYVLPAFIIPYLHIIIGVLGVPFDLLLSTDAYYFALFPVVEQIVTGFGVSSLSAAYAMIIGNIIGTFVSPLSPALWLALGLAGLEMGRHIRYSFMMMWGFSIVLLAIAIVIGVI